MRNDDGGSMNSKQRFRMRLPELPVKLTLNTGPSVQDISSRKGNGFSFSVHSN